MKKFERRLCCVLDPWIMCKNCSWTCCFRCNYPPESNIASDKVSNPEWLENHQATCIKPEVVMTIMYDGK